MASVPRINENLVIDALDNVVNGENPEAGLMVHTDRGSQCASSRFCGELEDRGFVQSFSRKGCPYDNAVMESFFKTLKRELPPPRSQVRHPDRGRAGDIQVHRAVLQYQAAAFVPRQPIARGI